MKLPKAVSIPQMAMRGPAGTPNRFSIDENRAALADLMPLPRVAMAGPPRFAMNWSRLSLKLFWPRSALMVPTEYLVAMSAAIALDPTPLPEASPAKTFFQPSKPPLLLPHGAASAGP